MFKVCNVDCVEIVETSKQTKFSYSQLVLKCIALSPRVGSDEEALTGQLLAMATECYQL